MTLARVYPESVGTFQLDADHRYTIGPEGCRIAVNLALREPWIACDIETAGLGELGMDIKCVTIGTADHAVVLDPRDRDQMGAIWRVFNDSKATLVFHNAAFDVPYLVRNGLMEAPAIARVEDTLLYARFAEPDERTRKGLGDCSIRYLGTPPGAGLLEKAFKTAGFNRKDGYLEFDIDRPIYVFGAVEDVLTTAAIYPLVVRAAINRLRDHPFGPRGCRDMGDVKHLLNREQTINRMFIRRSAKGYRVDYEFLDRYRAENMAQVDADAQFLREAGVEPGKAAQLVALLEEQGAIPFGYPTTAKGGKPSTAKDNLKLIAHPVAQAYVRHKELLHVDKDYLQKCVDLASHDGRIHPTTAILAAVTGRSSMGTPPLQQFSKPARGIVLFEEGDIGVSIDWAQIEPVVVSNLAHEYGALDHYEAGGDYYAGVGEAGGISRGEAKTTLLAQLYGQGMSELCKRLEVSERVGYQIRDAVYRPLPLVKRLVKQTGDIASVHKSIFTLSGRIVPVDPQYAYKAVNYLTQGSAYDLLAEALLAVDQAGLGDGLYFGMHDEMVVSKEIAHDVRRIMERPPQRLIEAAGRVPVLRTDMEVLGERWVKPE